MVFVHVKFYIFVFSSDKTWNFIIGLHLNLHNKKFLFSKYNIYSFKNIIKLEKYFNKSHSSENICILIGFHLIGKHLSIEVTLIEVFNGYYLHKL